MLEILNEALSMNKISFTVALPAHSGPWPLIQFRHFFTDGRTPWRSDQPVARPLPKHRTNAHTHTQNIHALSGIRTHDPSVRAREDSSCLRPRGYCDRPMNKMVQII
jgi:hypothetical protein